jgi:hypothetical protein
MKLLNYKKNSVESVINWHVNMTCMQRAMNIKADISFYFQPELLALIFQTRSEIVYHGATKSNDIMVGIFIPLVF